MEKMVKILFKLEIDDDGYPPINFETLWAKSVTEKYYLIQNIPFYAKGVNFNDLIIASKDEENNLHFKKIKERGKHSTIRVIVLNSVMATSKIIDSLDKLGCKTEFMDDSFFAIDIPETVKLKNVLTFLDDLEERDIIGYEIGDLYL